MSLWQLAIAFCHNGMIGKGEELSFHDSCWSGKVQLAARVRELSGLKLRGKIPAEGFEMALESVHL
jgi:hypothetical protein